MDDTLLSDTPDPSLEKLACMQDYNYYASCVYMQD